MIKDTLQFIKELFINSDVKSFDIDWFSPREVRLFVQHDNKRYCLSKIFPSEVSNYHNHPWRKEMLLIKGNAKQSISTNLNEADYNREHDTAVDNEYIDSNKFATFYHVPGDHFSIDSIYTWHKLEAVDVPAYFVMITEMPWTKGPKSPNGEVKAASNKQIKDILSVFQEYLKKLPK